MTRDLVVALRKKNLSVYDIQSELASQGHTISVNSLSVLLREEGFARLPRPRDEERPARIKPARAMEVWFQHVQRLGLSYSGSLDLDFHSVPANSEQEPL